MKISRIIFTIITVICAIIVVTVFLRLIKNKNSTEVFQTPANTEYPRWELPEAAKMRLGKGEINNITFSPDGTRFAVATTIGVWIYDAKTGNEISLLSLLKVERQKIVGVAFIENGNTVLGVNSVGEIIKWNAENGELEFILSNENAPFLTSAVFSTDGKKLYGVGRDEEIYVWELNDHLNTQFIAPIFTELKLDIEFDGGYGTIISLSPDGRFLATPSEEDDNMYFPIHVCDAQTGKLLFNRKEVSDHPGIATRPYPERVNDIVFSPDNKRLACLR